MGCLVRKACLETAIRIRLRLWRPHPQWQLHLGLTEEVDKHVVVGGRPVHATKVGMGVIVRDCQVHTIKVGMNMIMEDPPVHFRLFAMQVGMHMIMEDHPVQFRVFAMQVAMLVITGDRPVQFQFPTIKVARYMPRLDQPAHHIIFKTRLLRRQVLRWTPCSGQRRRRLFAC